MICVASNEQHSEHLAMEHDLASVVHIAREAAKRLFPRVVSRPMAWDFEHHMHHKGDHLSPAGRLAGCALRRGGGEPGPARGEECAHFQRPRGEFPAGDGVHRSDCGITEANAPGVNLQFCLLLGPAFREIPARTYGTDIIRDMPKSSRRPSDSPCSREGPTEVHAGMEIRSLLATAEKGGLFVEEAICQTVDYLEKNDGGRIGMPE